MQKRIRERIAVARTERDGLHFHASERHGVPLHSAWSSAQLALGLLTVDPDAAAAELRALYAGLQSSSGSVALERALDGDAGAPLYDETGRCVLMAPPVAAFAAASLARKMGAPGRDLLECATAQLDAIWGERLPPDTILPVIFHPLESGPWGSSIFDGVIDASERPDWDEEVETLARSAAACELQPEKILRAGHTFVVEDPVFCGWMLIALEEASAAWAEIGETAPETKLRIRSEMIADGIGDRLWWGEAELFVGYDRLRETPLRSITAGGLVPTAAKKLIQLGNAKRAVERHLRPGSSDLWNERGIAYNPIEREAGFDPAEIEWRGNAISPITMYWAHLALVRSQRPADARVVTGQLEALLEAGGFKHFFDATTGEPTHEGCVLAAALWLEMDAVDRA